MCRRNPYRIRNKYTYYLDVSADGMTGMLIISSCIINNRLQIISLTIVPLIDSPISSIADMELVLLPAFLYNT